MTGKESLVAEKYATYEDLTALTKENKTFPQIRISPHVWEN